MDSKDNMVQRERVRGPNIERGVIRRFYPLLVVGRESLDPFHLVQSH